MEPKNNNEKKLPAQSIPSNKLQVTIISADENVFDGSIKTLTSVNKDGEFDILPLHTNFITLIKDKITLYKESKEKKELTITNGVLKVAENKVDIILGPFVGADILPEKLINNKEEKTGIITLLKERLNFQKPNNSLEKQPADA